MTQSPERSEGSSPRILCRRVLDYWGNGVFSGKRRRTCTKDAATLCREVIRFPTLPLGSLSSLKRNFFPSIPTLYAKRLCVAFKNSFPMHAMNCSASVLVVTGSALAMKREAWIFSSALDSDFMVLSLSRAMQGTREMSCHEDTSAEFLRERAQTFTKKSIHHGFARKRRGCTRVMICFAWLSRKGVVLIRVAFVSFPPAINSFMRRAGTVNFFCHRAKNFLQISPSSTILTTKELLYES